MTPEDYRSAVEPYAAALRMIRDATGELFGPVASLESEEATLLRGPEPQHEAEAIIAALQRVRDKMEGRRPPDPCAICGGVHDNDGLTDICCACEQRIADEGSP
jgi:hypothetical protein